MNQFYHNLFVAIIDIERIIQEKDFGVVEKYIENILEYNLDPDQMRVLDPSFVKLFRLSQLSVEIGRAHV